MKNRIFIFLMLLFSLSPIVQSQRRTPTVDDLLNIKTAGGAQISPDGKFVAFTISEADWKQDAFVSQLWLAEVATGKTLQLTRGEKPSSNPQWSPDGAWLAFMSTRVGDKNQIFVISPHGGEARQLTKAKNGANGFAWSRDGKHVAFTATDTDQKVVGVFLTGLVTSTVIRPIA